jgi:hypothetical protein
MNLDGSKVRGGVSVGRRGALVLGVVLACVSGLMALAGGAAAAGIDLAGTSALSPALAELATPAVHEQSVADQAEALGYPLEGSGSLLREGGRVVVEAHFDGGAVAAIGAAEAAGAKLITASRRYQTLVLSVAPADLAALAAVADIEKVEPAVAPQIAAVGGAGTAAVASNGLCEGGSVVTQGLGQLNVAAARAAFGARGAGETIGVLSDSFDSGTQNIYGEPMASDAHGDEVTNDLPGPASTCGGQQVPVQVLAEDPAGQPAAAYTDEGRAMLQVVHDLAPQAKLAFATGLPSEIAYAQNIEKLAAPVSAGGAGADVIVDDLAYSSEPFFQEGPVAEAVRRVREKGVIYLTAAQNESLRNAAGDEISSWEAPTYRSSTGCNAKVTEAIDDLLAETGGGPYEPDCMDFDPSAGVDTEFGITVRPGAEATLVVQWAEPWYGLETDLLGFLVGEGPGGEEEVVSGKGEFTLQTKPWLEFAWTNEAATAKTVQLVIARCSGPNCDPAASATADPRVKFGIFEDGSSGVSEIEYPVSAGGDIVGPVIYGHAGSPAATTIGAVNYEEATTPRSPEVYSSRGPVTHYFGPVENTTPAAPLGAPEVIQKPDLTATDCASTTFFEERRPDGYHFCGSSEAVEHAGAVAALMQQTEPLATPAQIIAAMESTATPFSVESSPDAVGAGMLNADAAMTALGSSPVVDPPSQVVPSVEEEAKKRAEEEARRKAEEAKPALPTPTAPTVTITSGPKALGNQTRPVFGFGSSRPASFVCQVDSGPKLPCASPYAVPTKLVDGTHTFVVTATDSEGASGTSTPYAFTVDTTAPVARFVRAPKKLIVTRGRTVLAGFVLAVNRSPVTFLCRIDGGPQHVCGARFHRHFGLGVHVVRVRAEDAAGNLSKRPTTYRFRVARR